MSKLKPEDKKLHTAINKAMASNDFYDTILEAAQAKQIRQLRAEVKKLKKKIKVICIGIKQPKYPPKRDKAILNGSLHDSFDWKDPKVAFIYGWELAILECGEILNKP